MSPASTARLRPFQPVPFGRYTLLAPLSVGGMGEIFLARLEGPSGFEKLCVIKKILPQLAAEQDFVSRFMNEGKILVKLSHGSIAQVLEMGLHEGAPYIALEFIDGKDLRKIAGRLRERGERFPIPVALYVMTRVLDALGYAHRKRDDQDRELQLVHRDVSPQNVLVSYEGEVKVIDFGLAKSSLSTARTNPAVVLGKFLYMSPEQARHQKVDRRSDLYAAGLCLYELIAGKNPLEEAAASDMLAQVANPAFTPLHTAAPHCPPQVADAVMRALSRDPAQRFQTAEELRARLVAALLEIDPEAGAESTATFMRALFAAEFQQERRRLAAVREQLNAPLDERVAAGKRRTMAELPALRIEEDGSIASVPAPLAPAPVVEPPRPAGPPPLPGARAAAQRPANPPARAAELEPTRPGGISPLLAELAAAEPSGAPSGPPRPGAPTAQLADTAPGVRSPQAAEAIGSVAPQLEDTAPRVRSPFAAEAMGSGAPSSLVEPTRPGVPSPLLAEAAAGRSPSLAEPTRPGIPSPLLAEMAAGRSPSAADPTRPGFPSPLGELLEAAHEPTAPTGSPLRDPPVSVGTAPTREIAVQIPEGARPTPAPQLAVVPPAPPTETAAPLPPPVLPPPVSVAPPTLPAMRAQRPPAAQEPPAVEEPPLVMGTLLAEQEPAPQPAPSAPPPRSARRDTAPSRPPVPARTFSEPTLPRATPLRTASDDRVPTRELPQPKRLGWVGALVALAVIALAGYFAHGFYEARLFDGLLVHLSPQLRSRLHIHRIEVSTEPATPEAKPIGPISAPPGPPGMTTAAAPSPAGSADTESARADAKPAPKAEPTADDDLALLHSLPPVAHPSRRRPPPRKVSALAREWHHARSDFRRLTAQTPCEAAGMAMLCTRYRALEASVEEANGGEDAKLLARVKELRRLIAKKASP